MKDATIGVLLSRRQWTNLKRSNSEDYEIVNLYAQKGASLNVQILFFTLSQISFRDGTVKGAVITNEEIIDVESVSIPSIIYNPTKYTRKKNIQQIRKLSQMSNITMINEHHVIKNDHLFELIQSESEMTGLIGRENKGIFTFFLLGQKNKNHEWRIPILYVKDLDVNRYTFEEIKEFLFPYHMESESTEEFLYKVTQTILEKIHLYYPGVFEIGLEFIISGSGKIQLKSNSSIKYILSDLNNWNQDKFIEIAQWPIMLAHEMLVNDQDNHRLPLLEEMQEPLENKVNTESESPSIAVSNEDVGEYWVTLEEFHDQHEEVQLPREMADRFETDITTFQFGVKQQGCTVSSVDVDADMTDNSYYHPITIFVSTSLSKKLHLPLGYVFQMKVGFEKMTLGPTIGFLLGEKNQVYNPKYMNKYSDRLGQYEQFGGVIIAFSTRSIDWQEQIAHGMIYNPVQKVWEYGSSPIPSSLYRRNFHQDEIRVQKLINLTNNQLFNSHHFNKSHLLQLKNEPIISKHLPTTYPLKSLEHLVDFIEEKQKIILKPVGLSRGRGIYIIERNAENGEIMIIDYSSKYRIRHFVNGIDELKELITSFQLLDNDYLFQTYIPLLKVADRPFDVRVVMQKYAEKMWRCSGIECRVAGENEDLTNIARGGDALSLEDAIQKADQTLNYHAIYRRILTVCHQFCEVMDNTEKHYAEFGLDIALDKQGNPWILEANIFPSFKGFKKMDYNTYLNIRHQPLEYAVTLQGFSVVEKEEHSSEMYDKNRSYH